MTLFSPTSPFPFTLSQACLLKQTRNALSFPCPSFCLSPPWRIKYTVLVWGKVASTHIFLQTAFSLTWMYATQGACPVASSMMNEMPYLLNILLTASLLSMRLTSWHLSEKNKQCPFKKQARIMWACAWMCIYFYAMMKNEMFLKYFTLFWKEIQSNKNYYMQSCH